MATVISGSGYPSGNYSQDGNGNWQPVIANTTGTLLPSATRTATTVSPIQTNYNHRGVVIYLNVTAASGTGGLIVRIGTQDPVSGNMLWMNGAPAAVTATGLYLHQLNPGIVASVNVVSGTNLVLPKNWYVTIVHGDATSYTYSVGYALIL